jgi:K+-transporting ATPase ATPase C chain
MKNNLKIAFLMTLTTTILLGIAYPLVVTALAQVLFHDKANGQLISRNGGIVGSQIIGQAFTGAQYFHSRPSAAGTGYDAANSGGTNLGPTNQKLINRVNQDVEKAEAENPGKAIPVDMVTTSASGLDPEITPANAEFQLSRVARARGMHEDEVEALIRKHLQNRQFGLLGEPRVNVLELNLNLDAVEGAKKQAHR